jgi:diacylglycerol kinase (ATP)
VILIPAAFWLGDTAVERALLVGSLLLTLVAEILNAAIEATVDRISLERHPLAKRAKDLGSAAVMVALVSAALVWVLVLVS